MTFSRVRSLASCAAFRFLSAMPFRATRLVGRFDHPFVFSGEVNANCTAERCDVDSDALNRQKP